jgi:O-antigen/teichoic acid export membrane protein
VPHPAGDATVEATASLGAAATPDEHPPAARSTLLRRILALFSAGLLGQAVGIISGVVQARTLGPDGKAVLAYAVIALALVLLGTDGLSSAALMQAGKHKGALRQIHAATVCAAAGLALPCAVVALALGILVPSQRPLIGVAVALPFAVYAQAVRGILLAAGATFAVAWQGLITAVGLGIALMAALLLLHISSYQALTLWCLAQVAAAVFTVVVVRGRIAAAPRDTPPDVSVGGLLREQIDFGARTSAATIAGYVNMRIDVFLISALLGPRLLGIYTLAIATGEMLWSVSLPIVYAALERIAGDSFADAALLTARLMRTVVAFQLVLAVALFVAGPWLIVRVYGSAFADAGTVLRVLLPGMWVYAVEVFLGYFILVQARRPLLIFAIQSGSAVVCALLTFATVGRFGIVGAAFATSLTYVGVILFKSIYFSRKTGIGLRRQWIAGPDDVRALMQRIRRRSRSSGEAPAAA